MLELRGQLDVVETIVVNAVRAQWKEVKPEVAVTSNVDVGNKVDRHLDLDILGIAESHLINNDVHL
ncbi:hypothetical protein DPMN_053231 [Dreissena polymorpha]|uniref:Uncharacterized protein n=1 Tax=Dreissena polymorpha TaxID=45954 RepID=A0A9D4HQG9_DREPO|nr:hypothetical protein DPMN_053231 [Dreissena polymorpha]